MSMSSNIRIEQLASVLQKHFVKAEHGHCARVDFLSREESLAVCQYMHQHDADYPFLARLLVASQEPEHRHLSLTTDQAIELRNLKQHTLCLFVPTDMVDAAVSSLGNSFAPIDGRELLVKARERIDKQLSSQASQLVRTVFARLRGTMKVGEEQRLDFVCAIYELQQAGQLEKAGLELWRVGLIADASERFDSRLDENRRCVREIKRPEKIHATVSERIQKLMVDVQTSNVLTRFFRGRALYDVYSWSRALAEGHGPTFDRWTFPESIPSDIHNVTLKPFVDTRGAVRKGSRLAQPGGPGTSLYAYYGEKDSIFVQWTTEPKTPQNLSRWLVSIVPSTKDESDDEPGDEETIELVAREIAGYRRSLTLKLDTIEEALSEEQDNSVVRVKVVPLDSSGSQIRSAEDDRPLMDMSAEFALRPEHERQQPSGPDPQRDIRRTVPTIAYGRLAELVEKNLESLHESEPLTGNDMDYFSLKLNKKHVMVIGLSSTLVALERETLATPQQGGRYVLTVSEVAPNITEHFAPVPVERNDSDEWKAFWQERERFFKHFGSSNAPRDLIETANWGEDLEKAAQKYARSYQRLLDSLVSTDAPADRDALMDALSIDTVLVRLRFAPDNIEEAFLLLPTHPLRGAWVARYTSEFRQWEAELLERNRNQRKQALDLEALQMLAPINVPAFAYHPHARHPGVFFQNLHLYHGVAFPSHTPDPQRFFGDLATILGAQAGDIPSFRLQPDRMAHHISHFVALHPYVQTLNINLINPDRGNLLATALQSVLQPDMGANDDDEPMITPPRCYITAYVTDIRKSRGEALEKLRQINTAQLSAAETDYFLPNLSTTLRQLSDQQSTCLEDAHIAIGTDLTRPQSVAIPAERRPMSSFSCKGLLSRFLLSFSRDEDGLRWRYQIVPEESTKDDLVKLHTALLRAGGYLLQGEAGYIPALEIAVDTAQQHLLEQMHQQANWVITLDRFFVLDYFDSPFEPSLENIARKYVLDYAPEFVEGVGHRLMVTTTWQDEIVAILERAMEELGFLVVAQSIHDLLHYLKIVSGRLVLQAFESSSHATAAVGLGVVTAWLQNTGKLANAILIPVDPHPRLFMQHTKGKPTAGERRCDLMLVTLKRNIVEATFIEVKWRRGRAPVEEIAHDMLLQMEGTAQMIAQRFFNPDRLDGALQRTYLANVLQFYLERAIRYQLVDSETAQTFLQHLANLEKSGLDFRPSYEGYIVSLDSQSRSPFAVGDAKITLLTAEDFAESTDFQTRFTVQSEAELEPVDNEPAAAESEETRPGESELPIEAQTEEAIQPIETHDSDEQTEEKKPKQEEATHSDEVVIPLGDAHGVEIAWKPGVKGSPHLFVLGIPGQGKSWAVTRMLTALGQQNIPALVLDFHGQFADADGPFVAKVSPVVIDAARGLPFSPFECAADEGTDGWRANSFGLAEIFGYVAGLGDMQRDLVFTAIRDAYAARGFSDDMTDEPELPTLHEVLALIEKREQSSRTANVTARCRPLFEMDLFRPDGQEFHTLVKQGVVIDLHNLYVETLQMAAGAFVLRKIYKDMFRWGPSNRLRLAIVLDEAHRLARDVTLPKIMKEGRKFGIAVIVASQGLSDFHQDIVSNAGTKVIFRVNYPESRKIAGFIRARQGQELSARLEQLSVGTAYIQTPEMAFGSVVRMYPLDDTDTQA